MNEDWKITERNFGAWLYRNKAKLGIDHVGQIEAWIRLNTGEYHFFELKTQEPFDPPPFSGHGLPRWQVQKYVQMQTDLRVIWELLVCDSKTGVGYRQRLTMLEDGPYHDTHGGNPRRIYPLSSFDIWTKDWRKILG